MYNISLSEGSYEIIVSTLINSVIDAENNNKNGINDAYIAACNNALEELKKRKPL